MALTRASSDLFSTGPDSAAHGWTTCFDTAANVSMTVPLKVMVYGYLLAQRPRRENSDDLPKGKPVRANQCDIRVGMVMEPRIPRVTPPRTNSRSREWP